MVLLLVVAALVSGLLAGASLDQSIEQLPARHRIGVRAYLAYSHASHMANGRFWLVPLGIAGPVLSIAAASKIIFAERDGSPLESALTGSPVLYLVGPEGGWTERELSAASEKGFHAVSLGATILKSETAAIVGGSLIRYELGK